MDRLTELSYWNEGYKKRDTISPVEIKGYKNYCAMRIMKILSLADLHNKRVLEIGGGGSEWLTYLAAVYPDSKFSAIDYSEHGTELLEEYAAENNLNNIDTICADFFDYDPGFDKFDVIYSLGVVEHFSDLSGVLSAIKNLVAEDGVIITFIPNMTWIMGALAKAFNKDIYNLHVPHNKSTFVEGHKKAGLEILQAGYLCSTNYGILSGCFDCQSGIKWSIYKQLTRISKLVWLLESNIIQLPASRLFSPYIYAISKKHD